MQCFRKVPRSILSSRTAPAAALRCHFHAAGQRTTQHLRRNTPLNSILPSASWKRAIPTLDPPTSTLRPLRPFGMKSQFFKSTTPANGAAERQSKVLEGWPISVASSSVATKAKLATPPQSISSLVEKTSTEFRPSATPSTGPTGDNFGMEAQFFESIRRHGAASQKNSGHSTFLLAFRQPPTPTTPFRSDGDIKDDGPASAIPPTEQSQVQVPAPKSKHEPEPELPFWAEVLARMVGQGLGLGLRMLVFYYAFVTTTEILERRDGKKAAKRNADSEGDHDDDSEGDDDREKDEESEGIAERTAMY